MPLFKLLKDFQGFAKGTVIQVRGASWLEAMQHGAGELYVPPVEEETAKPKKKVTGKGKGSKASSSQQSKKK